MVAQAGLVADAVFMVETAPSQLILVTRRGGLPCNTFREEWKELDLFICGFVRKLYSQDCPRLCHFWGRLFRRTFSDTSAARWKRRSRTHSMSAAQIWE